MRRAGKLTIYHFMKILRVFNIGWFQVCGYIIGYPSLKNNACKCSNLGIDLVKNGCFLMILKILHILMHKIIQKDKKNTTLINT